MAARDTGIRGVVTLVAMFTAVSEALAGEAREGFNGGDLGQFIASIAIFLLLLTVLRRWAWKPIVAALRHREQSIADALERAAKRDEESQDLLAHYRARLKRAEDDAKAILDSSRKQAAEAREETLDGARAEGRKYLQQATSEVEQAKVAALRELYDRTAQLATDVAGQVIRRSLSPEDHQRLVQQSLEEIRKRAGEGQ